MTLIDVGLDQEVLDLLESAKETAHLLYYIEKNNIGDKNTRVMVHNARFDLEDAIEGVERLSEKEHDKAKEKAGELGDLMGKMFSELSKP